MGRLRIMIAALAVLGACHSEETRERIRNGDLERTVEASNSAQAAPAAPTQPQ